MKLLEICLVGLKTGVKTALLAPTAMNQQKFKFILNDNTVKVKPGLGFYTKLDLGIVKFHFEIELERTTLYGNKAEKSSFFINYNFLKSNYLKNKVTMLKCKCKERRN